MGALRWNAQRLDPDATRSPRLIGSATAFQLSWPGPKGSVTEMRRLQSSAWGAMTSSARASREKTGAWRQRQRAWQLLQHTEQGGRQFLEAVAAMSL